RRPSDELHGGMHAAEDAADGPADIAAVFVGSGQLGIGALGTVAGGAVVAVALGQLGAGAAIDGAAVEVQQLAFALDYVGGHVGQTLMPCGKLGELEALEFAVDFDHGVDRRGFKALIGDAAVEAQRFAHVLAVQVGKPAVVGDGVRLVAAPCCDECAHELWPWFGGGRGFTTRPRRKPVDQPRAAECVGDAQLAGGSPVPVSVAAAPSSLGSLSSWSD